MLPNNILLQNRYQILQTINKGGMGTVYLALDQRLGNKVALKEILVNPSNSSGTKEMLAVAFEKEARLLASLRHKSLPKVTDHFLENDGQFLVMELINGQDLAELLVKQNMPFPFTNVLVWAKQLLEVLDYIHTQPSPIIHRDIKPSNIKLTEQGEVILLDFGLAKGKTQQFHSTALEKSVFGYTLNYAPLEQIQGSGTDPRSDLYSLGATLYHLMTNYVPTDVLTRTESLIAQKEDPLIPANNLNSQIPREIALILTKAMAVNREQRYTNAKEMRQALESNNLLKQLNASGLVTLESSNNSLNSNAVTLPETKIDIKSQPNENSYIPQTKIATDLIKLPINSELEGASEAKVRTNSRLFGQKLILVIGVTTLAILIVFFGWIKFNNTGANSSETVNNSNTSKDRNLPNKQANSVNNLASRQTSEEALSSNEDKKIIRYWLEIMKETTLRSPEMDKFQPMFGENFRLHFTSYQPGYLYIIGSGKGNKLTTFLTTKPIPASGVKTNFIKDGLDFTFPNGKQWLTVGKTKEENKFIVIFSPTVLTNPNFINAQAGSQLTSEDNQLLNTLISGLIPSKSTIINGMSEVTISFSKSQLPEKPVVFYINL